MSEPIKRMYQGVEHVVTPHADGTWEYNGVRYTSLTSIAKKITGYTSISGPAFFSSPGRNGHTTNGNGQARRVSVHDLGFLFEKGVEWQGKTYFSAEALVDARHAQQAEMLKGDRIAKLQAELAALQG